MTKKIVKGFKEIEEDKYVDYFVITEVYFIEIYDENANLVKTFDKRDSDSNEGFIIKANKFARGGRLRVKYNYIEII